jgi:hypothetical protein
MWAFVGVLLAAVVVVLEACSLTEHTSCFAHFESRPAAERAAAAGAALGFDPDVEPSGPRERDRNSPGARQISVTFRHDKTGDEAARLEAAFREIVKRENGGLGHPGGCLEKSLGD